MDITPLVMKPTWRNGSASPAGIAKRLDRFLISDQLMEGAIRSRSWVISSRISDHNLVFLQLVGLDLSPKFPFKFNHAWLKEKDFKQLVEDCWQHNE